MHLPLSAVCNLPQDLLVAVPVLIDITALRHPTLLVQGKRELQLQGGEGVGENEKREREKKQHFRLSVITATSSKACGRKLNSPTDTQTPWPGTYCGVPNLREKSHALQKPLAFSTLCYYKVFVVLLKCMGHNGSPLQTHPHTPPFTKAIAVPLRH